MYPSRNTDKPRLLLEQDKRIFRTSDLAVLWSIENKNTLLTTIKRYTKRQILYRIYKGVYATTPLTKLEPFELGCALAGPLSYISTETVLSTEGIMMQAVEKITVVGKKNREYSVGGIHFTCRYLNTQLLVNRVGIADKLRYSIASPERAVVDLQHLMPHYYLDNPRAIDQEKVKTIQTLLGFL